MGSTRPESQGLDGFGFETLGFLTHCFITKEVTAKDDSVPEGGPAIPPPTLSAPAGPDLAWLGKVEILLQLQ